MPGARGAALAVLLRTGQPLTGRRVHQLTVGDYSLGAVQQALKSWEDLGVVTSVRAGRANLYQVNDSHGAVPALRSLVSPWRVLTDAVDGVIDERVHSVLVFGSAATGRDGVGSDIDLAVIAEPDWDGQYSLSDNVSSVMGNACDVLVFTEDEFRRLAAQGEPVIAEILRDAVALVGTLPNVGKERNR